MGPPVYEKLNQTPNYVDSINGFYTYLTDPIYLPAGTYFFGYRQTNATILNLGLDTNTPADASRKFINFNGNWTTSQLPGMWMIRPAFSSQPLDVGSNEINSHTPINLFPVPAKDLINISFNHADKDRMNIKVTDVTGRMVLKPVAFSPQLNVSSLSTGVYFLHISDPVTGSEFINKIVISGN
ncbi:MAG: T9SS type A sorting domain-containing protein [Bacteroidetes bacterium]|nr:T9SS type A sorting domain-containing protein [Bacteroidota bacterium]